MKVSIAIPVYEMRGSGTYFLRESIERIKSQSFQDIEVIISDHSINDEIENLCKGYLNEVPIFYFRNTEKRGNSSSNMNSAISKCRGDIIKLMMQDEYLCDRDSILKIHNTFLESDVNWCVTSCYYGNEINSIMGRVDPFYNENMFRGNNTIGSPSVVTIRREAKKYFDEDLIWLMDCDYYIRMKEDYGDPYIIKEPLVFVVQHDNQITSWLPQEIKEKEEIILKKRYFLDT